MERRAAGDRTNDCASGAERMKGLPERFGRAAAGGFTFLELVVALLILSIMMTLLFNGLRLGVRTWDSVAERTNALHESHLAQLFIKRQLEQAQSIAFAEEDGERRISFFGERYAIRFVSPLPAHIGHGGMYWFTIDVAEGKPARQLMLTYELFQTEDWERYRSVEPEKVILIDGLENAEFAYLAHAEPERQPRWTTRWARKDQLPHLVRLRLRFETAGTSRWQELLVAPKLATYQREQRATGVKRQADTHIAAQQEHLIGLETLLLGAQLGTAVTSSGWPVEEGRISSGFGWRVDPFTGRPARHNGVDIADRLGSTISAIGEGEVAYAGPKPGYGLLVEINHGDVVTRYAHTRENLVEAGDRVERGQPIARVGSSGRSTGPHLHFEVVKNGYPVNPKGYLTGF